MQGWASARRTGLEDVQLSPACVLSSASAFRAAKGRATPTGPEG
jgi:hypothetical protein